MLTRAGNWRWLLRLLSAAARPGAGAGCAVVAAEGVGVSGGELPGAVEEVVDHQELLVGIAGKEFIGFADEVAEYFLVTVGRGLGGLHHLAAAVAGGGPAADVACPLQAVEDRGDAAGGEAEQAGEVGWRQRPIAAEDVQRAHVGAVEAVPVGGGLIEPVDLGAQCPQAAEHLAWEGS